MFIFHLNKASHMAKSNFKLEEESEIFLFAQSRENEIGK